MNLSTYSDIFQKYEKIHIGILRNKKHMRRGGVCPICGAWYQDLMMHMRLHRKEEMSSEQRKGLRILPSRWYFTKCA